MKDSTDLTDIDITPLDENLAGMLSYNPVWYWIMTFIILAIIIITSFYLLQLKSNDSKEKTKPAKTSPHVQLAAEMDKAFLMVANKTISPQEACQRVSIILREYLHLKSGLPANSMTVTELQKMQAPPRIIENLNYLYPIVFGEQQIATYEEFLEFMNSSRAVIDGKWN